MELIQKHIRTDSLWLLLFWHRWFPLVSLKSVRCEFISEATKFVVLQSIFFDFTHTNNARQKGYDGTWSLVMLKHLMCYRYLYWQVILLALWFYYRQGPHNSTSNTRALSRKWNWRTKAVDGLHTAVTTMLWSLHTNCANIKCVTHSSWA
jgi:hypothetical protein